MALDSSEHLRVSRESHSRPTNSVSQRMGHRQPPWSMCNIPSSSWTSSLLENAPVSTLGLILCPMSSSRRRAPLTEVRCRSQQPPARSTTGSCSCKPPHPALSSTGQYPTAEELTPALGNSRNWTASCIRSSRTTNTVLEKMRPDSKPSTEHYSRGFNGAVRCVVESGSHRAAVRRGGSTRSRPVCRRQPPSELTVPG